MRCRRRHSVLVRARKLCARLLVVLSFALSACGGEAETEITVRGAAGAGTRNKLDILFMVDRSPSMAPLQANLVANFPRFMDVLEELPQGLPDLHVAVVSSDMGAGNGSVVRCTAGGDRGVFQVAPRGACKDTTLAAGARFISSSGGRANFTAPDISEVFACIALLGETGCGFERQMTAVARALGADGQPPPTENAGFLRADATLAVVFVTNEDDCSAPQGSTLYDSDSSRRIADPLGPPGNFRCNEFGHLCGSPLAPPPRRAPGDDVAANVTLEGCVPAEGSGLLTPVTVFANQLRALKADPNRVLVTAIAGPAQPYAVHWRSPLNGDTSPWPVVSHSCTAPDGSYGDPSIRLASLVDAFGANGLFYSVCEPDLAVALHLVATRISEVVDPEDAGTYADGGGGGTGGGADAGEEMDRGPRLAPRDGCMCDASGDTTPAWGITAACLAAYLLGARRRRGRVERSRW